MNVTFIYGIYGMDLKEHLWQVLREHASSNTTFRVILTVHYHLFQCQVSGRIESQMKPIQLVNIFKMRSLFCIQILIYIFNLQKRVC